MSSIVYAREENLAAEEFIDVLRRSGLDERRPVDDRSRIDRMLAHANLIITARDAGRLVGVSAIWATYKPDSYSAVTCRTWRSTSNISAAGSANA